MKNANGTNGFVLSDAHRKQALTVAENVHPIFAYYGWEYSMSGGVPSSHDIYLNIFNLMYAAAVADPIHGQVAESGRILVTYDEDLDKFSIYLGSLEEVK
jgi:hypothetical protein